MLNTRKWIIVALLLGPVPAAADHNTPPFQGTVWDLPSTLITEADPTSFRRVVEYVGELERHMWIYRDGQWHHGDQQAHVFEVAFRERSVEFQVLSELGDRAAAREEVDTYAPIIGRLPRALKEHVREVEIMEEGPQRVSSTARPHDWGDPSAGMISVHTQEASDVIRRGYMEEVFLHEGAHASLEADHRASHDWIDAQRSDPKFISTYAWDNPRREDFAETFSAWFAVRYRPETLSLDQEQQILEAVPARLAYLDRQGFDMAPYRPAMPVPAVPLAGLLLLWALAVLAARRQ